jgi:crossover junction endodeoxyribonuclease RuvC
MKLDASDGLAAALCHFYQSGTPASSKAFTGWKDFMKKNPGRVK